MSRKNTDYADCIWVDDTDGVSIDVHLDDYRALLSFLRAFDLHFRCVDKAPGGWQLTFNAGTTVSQVHGILAAFDQLSREWRS